VRAGRGERLYPTRVTVDEVTPVEISRAEIPQRSGWSVHLVIRQHYGQKWTREPWSLEVVRTPHGLRWLLDKSSIRDYRRFRTSPRICP
jgi:hypothetical protein